MPCCSGPFRLFIALAQLALFHLGALTSNFTSGLQLTPGSHQSGLSARSVARHIFQVLQDKSPRGKSACAQQGPRSLHQSHPESERHGHFQSFPRPPPNLLCHRTHARHSTGQLQCEFSRDLLPKTHCLTQSFLYLLEPFLHC